MWPRWLTALLVLLREAWSARRDAHIRFLKLQVEILRSRLPGNRIIPDPVERRRLLNAGAEVGHAVEHTLGVVSIKTYRRWLREEQGGRRPGKVGRPRMSKPLREFIVRLARENVGWGARRILGELKKLAVKTSRSSIRRVLVDEKILPAPERHAPRGVQTPWRKFIKMHMNVMVACDFFCKTVWTPLGKRAAYLLSFIHLGSRKVFLSPSTFHPADEWMRQQARNASMWAEDEGIDVRFVLHDHDGKFTQAFDEHFRRDDGGAVLTPYAAPIANSFVESWIGSLKRECLNHFLCFGLRQRDHIVQTYALYHNQFRPHQSLRNRPLGASHDPPPRPAGDSLGLIRRQSWLGGLLNHYSRQAAGMRRWPAWLGGDDCEPTIYDVLLHLDPSGLHTALIGGGEIFIPEMLAYLRRCAIFHAPTSRGTTLWPRPGPRQGNLQAIHQLALPVPLAPEGGRYKTQQSRDEAEGPEIISRSQ